MEGVFGEVGWPRAVRFLEALNHLRHGKTTAEAAQLVRTTKEKILALQSASSPPLAALGITALPAGPEELQRNATRLLGQMLLGRCAEMVFESHYRAEMQNEQLHLSNESGSGTDTDYRLLDGQGRYLFRINIKFHGAQFRDAKQWVDLLPSDCFPLATYKIRSALQKQDEEGKPYFFAIVGVPNLTAEAAGRRFEPALLEAASIILSANVDAKRKFEDAIVDYAVRTQSPAFREAYAAIEMAQWYVLSARRADLLLRSLLFERVFALRVRNFARVFRGAEVDMHFSLTRELVPLSTFFSHLREGGLVKVSTLLERGEL